MKTQLKSLAGLALAGLLAAPARGAVPARPAPNEIRAIEVRDGAGGVEVAIRSARPPSYTVFKLQDPPRLVVDLAGADVGAVASPVAVNRGGVREVTTAQYKDDRSAVGRVIIALEPAARYQVSPRGDAVVVAVSGASASAATPTSTSTASRNPPLTPGTGDSPAGTGERGTNPGELPTPTATKAATATRKATASPAPEDHVLSRRVDEAPVKHAATTLRGVRAEGGRVALALDGQVARVEVIELEDPPRLALDLYGVRRAPRGTVTLAGPFRQARFGRDAGKVRVVLDAAGELPRVEVKRVATGLAVTVPAPGRQAAPPARATAKVAAKAGAPATVEARREAKREAKVEAKAEVQAAPRDPAAARLAIAAQPAPVPPVEQAEGGAAGYAADAPAFAQAGSPQKRDYVGRRITLEFHDIEIRNLLRLIADVAKRNIIMADDVKGSITVSLRNVPWDQALDEVLKTKGLDKEVSGNIIRVAKFEDIAREQEARAKAAAARIPLVPLKVRLIPVNFARAADMASRVKEVLSERGAVTTDERTNVLIVKDVQEALARAEGLVRNLDTEIPQVRIESRIVEASNNFARQIGVQWGGNATMSAATGNPTGLFFPNTAGAAGGAGAGPTAGTSTSPNYAVNLPAAVGQGAGGALGFAFGTAGGAFNLNLRISALENSGVVKTISAPSVSTIDNKEATIGQGISIPFSQTSASGVNTTFVEAKLELKVTPHVSADGSILMKIKVTNNQPNPQLTGANGQPSISKREAETEALVHDGETTVIGGIYTRQTATALQEVPFLAKIPVLGFLFRNKNDTDSHTELLIFITPRILNRPATTIAAGQ